MQFWSRLTDKMWTCHTLTDTLCVIFIMKEILHFERKLTSPELQQIEKLKKSQKCMSFITLCAT